MVEGQIVGIMARIGTTTVVILDHPYGGDQVIAIKLPVSILESVFVWV
jgi:hypothetical protein